MSINSPLYPHHTIAAGIHKAIEARNSRLWHPTEKGRSETMLSRWVETDTAQTGPSPVADPGAIDNKSKSAAVEADDRPELSVYLVPVSRGDLLICVTRSGGRLLDTRTEFVPGTTYDPRSLTRRPLAARRHRSPIS